MNGAEWLQVQIEAGRLTPAPSMATLAKAAQILGATAQPDKRNGHRSEPPMAVMSEAHTQHATPTQ
jgi:hypothetical protein